jgi:tetratricopeptide (TPR) repeat protein
VDFEGEAGSQMQANGDVQPADELVEELSALKLENKRLVSEITRLKTQISDLSYGKLESERPVSPDTNLGDSALAGLLKMGNNDAIAPLVTKLKDNPESIGADIVDLQKRGLGNEALQLGILAVRVTPGNAALHMRWVRQVRYVKDFDLALAICNAAFEADGDQHLLRLNRGYLLYEAGRYQDAATDLDVAACADHPIEERLAAAAARAKVSVPSPGVQAQIISEHFSPAAATFDASNLDPAKVKASLERFGCAWIKGLFEPEMLAAFDRKIAVNVERVEETYRALGLPDTFNVGFPLYFASEPNREKAQGLFKSTYPSVFDPDRMVGADNSALANFIFKQLRCSGLDEAISTYLKMDPLYTSAAICHIRSFIPSGVKWFGEFHQDNRLYNSDAEILTLWFPFRYQHGPMPSLEFLPLRSKSHLPCVSVCGIDNEMFEPEAFWRPAYQLGDAMLLSGFVPHRTYVESDMTLERTSIDFRFFASPVPRPIYSLETTEGYRKQKLQNRSLPSSIKRFIPLPIKQAIKSVLHCIH